MKNYTGIGCFKVELSENFIAAWVSITMQGDWDKVLEMERKNEGTSK